METRTIGSLDVSVVGIGCNNFGRRIDASATDAVVRSALDAGLNFFDTADVYGDGASEELLGRALAGRRDEAIVATKFGNRMGGDPARQGGRPEYIRRACDDSLRRLGTDRIDLYQVHTPDDTVPIQDTLAALNELVDEGKVVEIGCSNFAAGPLDWAVRVSADNRYARFASVQNRYSLLHREPEEGVLSTCEKHDVAFIPYFPLEKGLLTGKYARGRPAAAGTRLAAMPSERARETLNDRNLRVVEALDAFARERDRRILDLAFSWLLARPAVVSVIAGATSPDQVAANAAAAGWALTGGELAEVDRLTPA